MVVCKRVIPICIVARRGPRLCIYRPCNSISDDRLRGLPSTYLYIELGRGMRCISGDSIHNVSILYNHSAPLPRFPLAVKHSFKNDVVNHTKFAGRTVSAHRTQMSIVFVYSR